MGEDQDRWNAGKEWIDRVYGAGFGDRYPAEPQGPPFLRSTLEHLFAEIWSRPGLALRDRRLLVLGATAALGRGDLIRIQALGALRNGELTPEELQEATLHLAHYVGWGSASAVGGGIDAAISDFEKETGDAAGQDIDQEGDAQ